MFFLAFALTGCAPVSAVAEMGAAGFDDVSSDAWYADAVVWCKEQGLMNGTSSTSFSPDDTLTRATLATVLHRAAGTPEAGGSARFSDVEEDAWYTKAVAWVSATGLMEGYGGGTFGANDPVTREQLATILWRYAGSPAPAVNSTTYSDISPYAKDSVSWAVENDLIREKANGQYDLKEKASRAEVADSIYRYMTRINTEPPGTPADTAPRLLYMGQASICVITPENKLIYIDPYAGDAYDLPADLILVTHGHFDHCAIDKVTERNVDCRIITHHEAVVNGEHQMFELPYVTIDAVEAGYNRWHDVNQCVGYVLTFSNGKSVYVTGDTSTTQQMSEMSDMEIDYAFYCCDGVYNMGLEEAARCAELVGAKHNIPYHNSTSNTGEMFDRELAEQWNAPNRLIIYPGEEIEIE